MIDDIPLSDGPFECKMSFCQRARGYAASGLKTAVDAALEYDTPKIVHIKNKTVGLVNRLVQLGIIVYIGV